jgi:hypothetical protein
LSRRDDLISLFYLLVSFFDGKTDWVNDIDFESPLFKQFRVIRLGQKPESLCHGKSAPLLPFMKEVFGYKFEENPNYGKLR